MDPQFVFPFIADSLAPWEACQLVLFAEYCPTQLLLAVA
jgi:hypothetical protein